MVLTVSSATPADKLDKVTSSGRKSIPTKIFTPETPKESKKQTKSKVTTPKVQPKREAKSSNAELGSIVEMELLEGIPSRCTIDFTVGEVQTRLSFNKSQVCTFLQVFVQ